MYKRGVTISLLTCGVVLLLAVVSLRAKAKQAKENGEVASGANGPVIVELFTSEGCSSCPPADEVLTRIEGKHAGADVIAMGEHVTYWDRLGWKDRFSQDVFTERQESYAKRFGLGSVYTPQAVVNGEAEVLGSDESRVRKAVASAAKQAQAKVELSVEAGDVVHYKVTGLPLGARGANVFLAVTETRLETDVRAGENNGRALRHTGVMRSIAPVGRVNEVKAEGFAGTAQARLDKTWRRENAKVVVFVQDRSSLRIWGAGAVGL